MLTRRKPMKRTPLRRVSAKRAKQLRTYSRLRKAFLARPENQWCPVCLSGVNGWTGAYVGTSQVHHKDGREGSLLNRENMWLAVSQQGHAWIHHNPNESRKRGWLV